MEPLFYLAKVMLYTALLWLVYRAVLSRNSFHRLNRLYLLAALVLPLVLPLVEIPTEPISADNVLLQRLPEIVVGGGQQMIAAAPEGIHWLPVIYLAIAGFLLGRLLVRHFTFRRKLRALEYQQETDYRLFTYTGMGPGSYGNNVFMPHNTDQQILAHELAHIRFGHQYDLLLIQLLKVVCWPNLFLHFIAKDLKLVHEYQADELAADSNTDTYVKTLLGEIFGTRYPALSHSFFHHPIKNRIMMLQKRSSHKKRFITAALGLAAAAGLVAGMTWLQSCNKQKQELQSGEVLHVVPDGAANVTRAAPDQMIYIDSTVSGGGLFIDIDEERGKTQGINKKSVSGGNFKSIEDYVPDKNGVYKYVSQMPEFINGDVSVWLSQNTKYPEAARKASEEGRVIVTFVVNANGKIEDVALGRSSKIPSLDEEAVRVVKAMPNWTPGRNKGKPVKVQFSLPITFKLD